MAFCEMMPFCGKIIFLRDVIFSRSDDVLRNNVILWTDNV